MGSLSILVIDFDDRANSAALDALGARLHPTIVLIDEAGEIVEVLVGRQSDEPLRAKVGELVERSAR